MADNLVNCKEVEVQLRNCIETYFVYTGVEAHLWLCDPQWFTLTKTKTYTEPYGVMSSS